MNIVVLVGTLRREPEMRTLPATSDLGHEVVTFDLAVLDGGGSRESVPVSCVDPPRAVSALAEGDEVLVTGRARRRFFRAGGVTQSRTDVLADHVVPTRQGKRAATALQRARALLDEHPIPG